MRKRFSRLLKVFVFVVLFFVLLLRFSYMLRPAITIEGNNEKLGLLGYYAEKENTIDVLYIGSSDATVFWIPLNAYRDAGFTSYTYGKSMLRASMFEDLLNEALRTQKPSLVVVSMRTILQSDNVIEEASLRSVTDALPYSSANRWKMIFHNRGNVVFSQNAAENGENGLPDKGILANIPLYFDIMKYHDNWQTVWEGSFHYDDLGRFSSSTKGFFIGTGVKSQNRDTSVPFRNETKEPALSAEKTLRALIEKAKKEKFEILFVMPPYCETAADRMLFNRAAEIIAGSGGKAVDFNEYYDLIGMDESLDYYDPGHTNILGARKFTAFLTGWLSENYDLPDHRGDPSYASWNEDLNAWTSSEADAMRKCLSKQRIDLPRK